jgi:orotate phosphoribosyltransferase
MTEAEVLEAYRSSGALRDGHFRLSSGLHSPTYFQSALVLADPHVAGRLGWTLASRFDPQAIDLVLGPALGAILVAHEVARSMTRRALFAERVDDRFVIRRGFVIDPGSRVLLTEDVLTTGRTVLELADLVRTSGGRVAGLACLVSRLEAPFDLGAPVEALVRGSAQAFRPEDCPNCRAGEPLDVPGSRRLAR